MSQKKSNKAPRVLGLWMLMALVAGNMVGSGAFLLPASLASYGSIGILAWVLTSLGAMILALVFSKFSMLDPRTGGPYAYCYDGFGKLIGFVVAYNYWIALWAGNAAIAVAFVGYLGFFFPMVASKYVFLSSASLVWFLTFVNLMGLRAAGIFQMVTTVLKLIPLLLIGFGGLAFVHWDYFHVWNISNQSTGHALMATATLTFWAFLGLESATVPADNTESPEKNIPRATIFGTLLAALVYIAGTISVMGMIPMAQLAQSSSPFADAALLMFGKWGAIVVALGAIISCLGALNGWILLQGQIPYAAAKDKLFPKFFTKTNKNGIPYVGVLTGSSLITVLLYFSTCDSLVSEFNTVILIATFSQLIPYFITCCAQLIYFIHHPKAIGKNPRFWVSIAVLGILYSFWAMAGAGMQVVYYGSLLFLSSIPLYVWVVWKEVHPSHSSEVAN